MTANEPDEPQPAAAPLRIEQLTESYRFDAELATLLTQFQYEKDGLTLTAAESRPIPTHHITAPTAGLNAVFEAGASLVFVCYADREHTMVNPIETVVIAALMEAIEQAPTARSDGGTDRPLGEGPTATADRPATHPTTRPTKTTGTEPHPTVGVVSPHNAQRGVLNTVLAEAVTANTVEKYQGGERDIIAVSATVSDPQFARHEDRFILNPRRLLVAISRSKRLTVVVCSTALFEVAPQDSDRLDAGPIWARLFTQAVGRDPTPAWAGSLGAFVGNTTGEHAAVPVEVYPSTIATDGGDR